MTTTVTFTPKEVEELIRQQLRQQGFEVSGSVTFNVHQGYSDPREQSGPGLTNVTVTVKPATVKPDRQPTGPPANMLNGAY